MIGPKKWTIGEIIRVTTEYLERNGIESPRLCAEILLAHQLKVDRVRLYLSFDQPLLEGEIVGYRSLIRRRLKREPVQYITGVQEFWSLDLHVGPQVMIPRPETELLVEQVLSLFREERLPENRHPKILDLGTGCGGLSISLGLELKEASIWATDISPEALDLARSNARKHRVDGKITFALGDLWQPITARDLRFDVILSNPPYVASEAMASLPPEVRDYEPRLAFDGGEEGMSFITKIITEAPKYLAPGGWVLLEMDPEQTSKSIELIDGSGSYASRERIMDYARHYRVVMAQTVSPATL